MPKYCLIRANRVQICENLVIKKSGKRHNLVFRFNYNIITDEKLTAFHNDRLG